MRDKKKVITLLRYMSKGDIKRAAYALTEEEAKEMLDKFHKTWRYVDVEGMKDE